MTRMMCPLRPAEHRLARIVAAAGSSTSSSVGSITSASAGRPSVTRLIQSRCSGSSGSGKPDERRDEHHERARRRCRPAGRRASCGCCRRCRGPRATAATMLAKLSSARTMSEASRVTSVPGPAHRDADVGLAQRGRVVDAVAGHRHDRAARLPARARSRSLSSGVARACTTLAGVLARPHDAQLARDGARRDRMVAGDHHGADARPRARAATASIASVRGGSAMPTRPSSSQVLLLVAGARRRRPARAGRAPPSRAFASAAPVGAATRTAAAATSSAPFT